MFLSVYQVLYFHEYHAAFVFTSVDIYLCNLSSLIRNMHPVLRQFVISCPGYKHKLTPCGLSSLLFSCSSTLILTVRCDHR